MDRQGLVPALLSEIPMAKAVSAPGTVGYALNREKRSMNFEKGFANLCAVKQKEEEGSNHFGLWEVIHKEKVHGSASAWIE